MDTVVKYTCAGIGCRMREHIRTSGLDPADAEYLENARVTMAYKRGDRVFSQGERAAGLYCIRSGHVLLWHLDATNHRTGFRVVGPGEIMGYRSMFGEEPHAATAEALTSCDICSFPKEAIYVVIDSCPDMARAFLRTLARDRGPPDGLLLRGQHLPVRVRIVFLLLILMDRYAQAIDGGGLLFQLPLLRRDIATMLSTRPESVARAIKELERDEIAIFRGRSVAVADRQRLHEEVRMHTARAKTSPDGL